MLPGTEGADSANDVLADNRAFVPVLLPVLFGYSILHFKSHEKYFRRVI